MQDPEIETSLFQSGQDLITPPTPTAQIQGPLQALQTSVSLEAEVPEALFQGMRDFISSHPQWDQYSVISSALAGFLFQNGSCDRSVRDHYLEGLFSET